MTFLKLNRLEILEYINQFQYLASIFAFIVFIDFVVYSIVNASLIDALSQNKSVTLDRVTGVLLIFQGWPSALCALFGLGILIGGPAGYMQALIEAKLRADIQSEVDEYIAKTGRSPDTFDDITRTSKTLREMIGKLDQEVQYRRKSERGYTLLFSGPDKKFGTSDDVEITAEHQLRQSYERWTNKLAGRSDERIESAGGPGWYLLTPPMAPKLDDCVYKAKRDLEDCVRRMTDSDAPRSQWRQVGAFTSLTACETARTNRIDSLKRIERKGGTPKDELIDRLYAHQIDDSECLVGNDPRLGSVTSTAQGGGSAWYWMLPPAELESIEVCAKRDMKDLGRCAATMVNTSVPISGWDHRGSFDSARACKQEREDEKDSVRKLPPPKTRELELQTKLYQRQIEKSKCISGNDPRLAR
jgi:hypothetical protein